MGVQIILGLMGVVLWFLAGAWAAVTGPQNLSGWIFMAAVAPAGAGLAKIIAWRTDRRAR